VFTGISLLGKCLGSLRLYVSHTSKKSGCREERGLVNLTTDGCKTLIFRGKIIFRRKVSEWRSAMSELKKQFRENENRYALVGDYYIPNLTLVEEER